MLRKVVIILFFFIYINIPTYSAEYTFSNKDVFDILLKSYPDIIQIVPPSENMHRDPAIRVNGTVFYWVNGRLLPENARARWASYAPNSFYGYAKTIRDPKTYTQQELNDIRKRSSKTYRKNQPSTHPLYYEKLYAMSELADTNTQIKKTTLFGKQVLVHKYAFAPLKKVESEIYKLAQTDKETRDFLRQMDTVYSFFWRRIAGSKARSLHSYGIAVDLLESKTKKSYYWLWRQNQKIDWVTEPLSIRWHPPKSVVDMFERYGFVWGGKWTFYDSMHFEYRPDLLLLNGYDVQFVR